MAPKIQWPLVLFSMLAGCGGCCFAFAGVAGALGESTTVTLWATGISLVLVVVGAVCSMMHLATPRHAFAAVTHLLSFSGISVELIMLGVVSALMAAYGAACLWFDNELARLVLGIAGAVAGVVLAFVTGHGYLISSKPTWNTKKLPLAYTGTALVAGGFLYAVVSVATGGVWAMELPVKLLLAVCAVFSAVTVAAYLGHLGMQTAKKNPTLFWVGIVVCGLVVPLACAAILLAPLPSMAFVAVAAVGFVAAMAGGSQPAHAHVDRRCGIPLLFRGRPSKSQRHSQLLAIFGGPVRKDRARPVKERWGNHDDPRRVLPGAGEPCEVVPPFRPSFQGAALPG